MGQKKKKKKNSAQISFSFFFVSLWLCLLLSVLFFILFFIFFGIQGIIVSMNWTQGTLPYISDGVASFIFFFFPSTSMFFISLLLAGRDIKQIIGGGSHPKSLICTMLMPLGGCRVVQFGSGWCWVVWSCKRITQLDKPTKHSLGWLRHEPSAMHAKQISWRLAHNIYTGKKARYL